MNLAEEGLTFPSRELLMTSALLCLLAAPTSMKVLFLGNSHTAFNDVPGMVKTILEADAQGARVAVEVRMGASLQSISQDQGAIKRIVQGKFTHVVLQGAALSSSHKYKYSQEGAIRLAKEAKKSGAEALLFAEWPRKGWKETGYILGIYKEIAKESQAKIVPVCSVFDRLLGMNPKLDLWQEDGNHATKAGSYVASLAIAQAISAQSSLKWKPAEIAESLQLAARKAVKESGRTIVP